MLIGAQVNDCDFTGYQGELADIRLYNYCLNVDEIKNLFSI
jgi:hypothetical protein